MDCVSCKEINSIFLDESSKERYPNSLRIYFKLSTAFIHDNPFVLFCLAYLHIKCTQYDSICNACVYYAALSFMERTQEYSQITEISDHQIKEEITKVKSFYLKFLDTLYKHIELEKKIIKITDKKHLIYGVATHSIVNNIAKELDMMAGDVKNWIGKFKIANEFMIRWMIDMLRTLYQNPWEHFRTKTILPDHIKKSEEIFDFCKILSRKTKSRSVYNNDANKNKKIYPKVKEVQNTQTVLDEMHRARIIKWFKLKATASVVECRAVTKASLLEAMVRNFKVCDEENLWNAWLKLRFTTIGKIEMCLQQMELNRNVSLHKEDWQMIDAMILYDELSVFETHVYSRKIVAALQWLFDLVVQNELEPLPADEAQRVQRWGNVCAKFRQRENAVSVIFLQKLWHELKAKTKLLVVNYWNSMQLRKEVSSNDLPRSVHLNIVKQYPDIVTSSLTPWKKLVEANQIVSTLCDKCLLGSNASVTPLRLQMSMGSGDYLTSDEDNTATSDLPDKFDNMVIDSGDSDSKETPTNEQKKRHLIESDDICEITSKKIKKDETFSNNEILSVLSELDPSKVKTSVVFESDSDDDSKSYDLEADKCDEVSAGHNYSVVDVKEDIVIANSDVVNEIPMINSVVDVVMEEDNNETQHTPMESSGSEELPKKLICTSSELVKANPDNGTTSFEENVFNIKADKKLSSKPIVKIQRIDQTDEFKRVFEDDQANSLLKVKSFRLRENKRKYSKLMLRRNPDFHPQLKKVSSEFLRLHSEAIASMKPVTVDVLRMGQGVFQYYASKLPTRPTEASSASEDEGTTDFHHEAVECDKDNGRISKRIELPDIDEVRRINKSILTAQVAPLTMGQDTDTDNAIKATDDGETSHKALETIISAQQLNMLIRAIERLQEEGELPNTKPGTKSCCLAYRHWVQFVAKTRANAKKQRPVALETLVHRHANGTLSDKCKCCCLHLLKKPSLLVKVESSFENHIITLFSQTPVPIKDGTVTKKLPDLCTSKDKAKRKKNKKINAVSDVIPPDEDISIPDKPSNSNLTNSEYQEQYKEWMRQKTLPNQFFKFEDNVGVKQDRPNAPDAASDANVTKLNIVDCIELSDDEDPKALTIPYTRIDIINNDTPKPAQSTSEPVEPKSTKGLVLEVNGLGMDNQNRTDVQQVISLDPNIISMLGNENYTNTIQNVRLVDNAQVQSPRSQILTPSNLRKVDIHIVPSVGTINDPLQSTSQNTSIDEGMATLTPNANVVLCNGSKAAAKTNLCPNAEVGPIITDVVSLQSENKLKCRQNEKGFVYLVARDTSGSKNIARVSELCAPNGFINNSHVISVKELVENERYCTAGIIAISETNTFLYVAPGYLLLTTQMADLNKCTFYTIDQKSLLFHPVDFTELSSSDSNNSDHINKLSKVSIGNELNKNNEDVIHKSDATEGVTASRVETIPKVVEDLGPKQNKGEPSPFVQRLKVKSFALMKEAPVVPPRYIFNKTGHYKMICEAPLLYTQVFQALSTLKEYRDLYKNKGTIYVYSCQTGSYITLSKMDSAPSYNPILGKKDNNTININNVLKLLAN